MDHFNVTVQKDGALVATRRGMQVSKHKYHGISFVNASVPTAPGSSGPISTGNTAKKSPGKGGGTFSTFSAFGPPAPTAAERTAAKSKTKTTTPATTSTPKPSTTSTPTTDKSSAEFVQPIPHRWKFVTKTAAAAGGKTGKTAKPKTDGAETARRQTSAARRTSPAVSDSTTPSSTAEPATPQSLPSSSFSPPSSGELILSFSPTTSTHSPKDDPSPDCEAEFISPSVAALRADSTTISNGSPKTGPKNNRRKPANGNRSPKDNALHKQNQRRAVTAIIEKSCQSISRSLPTWKMCRVPQLNDTEQRIFHQFFQLIPRKIYPFEDILQYNPARSSEFYWMVVQDRAAVRCVLMCGAMFRSVLSGENNSHELAHEVANVCGIVNEQLARVQYFQQKQRQQLKQNNQQLTRRQRHQQIPTMTLECITTLALMGGFTGRYDHWHVHMRGLKKIIEMNSGGYDENDPCAVDEDASTATMAALASLRPSLLAKMRKTDLKGAIALATVPYLPFTRTHPNASDAVLSLCLRQNTMETVETLLQPCGIRPAVVEAMGEMCIFVQAAQLANDLSKTATPLPLDPYAFAEELHWIMFLLVSQPGPLRQDIYDFEVSMASPGGGRNSPTDAASPASPSAVHVPVDTSRLKTENYIRNHQIPLTAPIVPAELDAGGDEFLGDPLLGSHTTFLEPAVRICALLYLKEFIPDFPRNLGGYAILLHLLRHHLKESLWGDDATPANSSLLMSGHSRAVLLWVCLVGDIVSRTADANEQREGADRYDRSVFRARLAELVASGSGLNDDGSPVGTTGTSLGDSLESLDSLEAMAMDTMNLKDGGDGLGLDLDGLGLSGDLSGNSSDGLGLSGLSPLGVHSLETGLSGLDNGLMFGFDGPLTTPMTTAATTPSSVDSLPDSDWTMCRMLDLSKIQHGWQDRQGLMSILEGI